MFIFPMISCLAIFLVDDAEWQPYSSEKGKFTVSFPGKPTEKIAGIKGQMCQVVAAEDPVVLTKYVVYYFPSPWEGEMGKEKLRDKLFEEAGKSLALKGLQGKGKKVSLQGYEGREFQVEGTLRIRMYLTPKSIFVVVAHGALRLPKEDVEKFFASFRFQMTCKEAVRRQRLEEGGGNAQSEAAVAAGLKWLASHQAQDGRWSLDQFHETAKCTCQGAGQADDVAGTAFAVLPFLGAGHFLETGLEYKENEKPLYAKNVERALKYLLARQDRNGKIGRSIQSHSLATMVLCEAYGLTKDPNWKEPAQRALDWLVSAQQSGGWKDEEAQNADLVLVFWSLMAIRNGQIAGLNVPTKSLMDITDSCAMKFKLCLT